MVSPYYINLLGKYGNRFCDYTRLSDLLEHIDHRRVLFGSDTHVHDQAWELGRLLSEDIPDEQLKDILAGNARRLFGE